MEESLISKIINELVDEKVSLTSPLLKIKVLASRIGNEELSAWVELELNGYNSYEELPEYRIASAQIFGTYVIGYNQISRAPILIEGLQKDQQELLKKNYFMNGVQSLESFLGEDKVFATQVPALLIKIIEKSIVDMGNPYYTLINCRLETSINKVINCLAIIRSKLLNFMLEIEKKFGLNIEIQELIKQSEVMNNLISNTIIGDGNFVSTGDKNKIEASVKVFKGNKESISEELESQKVEKKDIEELLFVLDQEKPDPIKRKFGTKVNAWIGRMINKSLEGTWQVGITTAGNILSNIIWKYYGN